MVALVVRLLLREFAGESDRSAIGATVTVQAAGRRQTLPVLSQSSFLSQSMAEWQPAEGFQPSRPDTWSSWWKVAEW